jgi:hypothetical protein
MSSQPDIYLNYIVTDGLKLVSDIIINLSNKGNSGNINVSLNYDCTCWSQATTPIHYTTLHYTTLHYTRSVDQYRRPTISLLHILKDSLNLGVRWVKLIARMRDVRSSQKF